MEKLMETKLEEEACVWWLLFIMCFRLLAKLRRFGCSSILLGLESALKSSCVRADLSKARNNRKHGGNNKTRLQIDRSSWYNL